tara:strand:+ start:145 stop:462 length:318 start_codon:yes stop_codon:yes gene_type:complete
MFVNIRPKFEENPAKERDGTNDEHGQPGTRTRIGNGYNDQTNGENYGNKAFLMDDFASTVFNLLIENSQGCKQAQKGKGSPMILVGKTREKIPRFGCVPDTEYLL